MRTFEYKVIDKMDSGTKGEKRLNALGAEGWELVAVNHGAPTGMLKVAVVQYIFKRETNRV